MTTALQQVVICDVAGCFVTANMTATKTSLSVGWSTPAGWTVDGWVGHVCPISDKPHDAARVSIATMAVVDKAT